MAADGDIVLVVGTEKLRIRVQSTILKAVSKPFSVMLGPNWREGRQQHATDVQQELQLPDDDAVSMKHICAVMHHQNHMVPAMLPVRDILSIAILVDKYDFVAAFTFASAAWLQPVNQEAGDLVVLAAAAALFQNAQSFKAITKALILDHDGSYLDLVHPDLEIAVGRKVVYLLEEQRNRARLKLAEIFIKGFTSGSCCHRCGWSSKYAYAYLKSLESGGLWPTGIRSISEAIKRAEDMPQPVPTEASIACQYAYKHTVPEYNRDRRSSLDSLREHIGLCLHCVRSGSTNSDYCEKSHRQA